MEIPIEKFSIEITDEGVDITNEGGKSLRFTAVEALMLLDILRNEEDHLREIADRISPHPLKINL